MLYNTTCTCICIVHVHVHGSTLIKQGITCGVVMSSNTLEILSTLCIYILYYSSNPCVDYILMHYIVCVWLSTRRGTLLSTAIFFYAATSPVNGYFGGALYSRMGGGELICVYMYMYMGGGGLPWVCHVALLFVWPCLLLSSFLLHLCNIYMYM